MKPLRDILSIIFLIAFPFFLLAGIAEPYIFDLFPPQIASDITIEQWKKSFQYGRLPESELLSVRVFYGTYWLSGLSKLTAHKTLESD